MLIACQQIVNIYTICNFEFLQRLVFLFQLSIYVIFDIYFIMNTVVLFLQDWVFVDLMCRTCNTFMIHFFKIKVCSKILMFI